MGKGKIGVALMAAMALVSAPAAAQEREARSFTMTGSWTLDAGDDYCRLAANFSNGDDRISFALERNRADNLARLVLVGDAIRTFRGAETLSYSFQPGGEARTTPYIRAETADNQPWFNLGLIAIGTAGPPQLPLPPYDRAAELAFAAQANGLLVDNGLQVPILIQTGPLRAPIQALQACTDDLLRVWGLDYAKHQNMTRRATPVGPASEWLSAGTFGFGDFPLFAGGRNPFRVMVDAEGRPTSCHVHWASLSERKNNSVCEQLLENARFEPALDATGQPMASYWMADPFMLMRPMGPGGRR